MKLGILVVYLVAEDDGQLLEIHLSQIEKTTSVPYRIYATANRLLPCFRERIERLPHVTICAAPDTGLRNAGEHAYYLGRLAEAAVADGVTHICTLHVDSFPISAAWAENIAARLHGDCVLAGVQRDEQNERKPVTDFMMFTREFYLAHHPGFLLSERERASAEYRRYLAECPHTWESGVGFGFKIWSERLTWFPLARVDRGKNRYSSGGIYGDLIFHLGGAVRHRSGAAEATRRDVRFAEILSRLRAVARWSIPWRIRKHLQAIFGRWIHERSTLPVLLTTREALLADPEGFLRELQDHR